MPQQDLRNTSKKVHARTQAHAHAEVVVFICSLFHYVDAMTETLGHKAATVSSSSLSQGGAGAVESNEAKGVTSKKG